MEKKFLSMLLALIMLLSLLPTMAFAATKSGTGWSFDTETGTLTISGELESAHPWIDAGVDAAQIISVVTKDGAKAPEDSSYMFQDHVNMKSADLSKLDTSNVEDMGYMFYDCSSLTTLDVSGFDTSKVTDMGHMFQTCSSLTQLKLPAQFYKGSDKTYLFTLHDTWYGSDGKTYTSDEQLRNNKAVTLTWDAPAVAGSVSYYRIYKWNGAEEKFEWIGGSLKAEGSKTSVTIPAAYVTPGVKTQYSIRGYNSKDVLGSMSIYAAAATAS